MGKITVEEARAVIAEHQKEEQSKKAEEVRRLYVGRFFRYRNSYGELREKWWLYAHVTGVDQFGHPIGVEFQDDGQGKLELRHDTSLITVPSPGWSEITAEEFERAAVAFGETVREKLNRKERV